MHSRLREMCEFLAYDGPDYRDFDFKPGADDLVQLLARAAAAQQAAPARAGPGARAVAGRPDELGVGRAARPAAADGAAPATRHPAGAVPPRPVLHLESATTAISTAACSMRRSRRVTCARSLPRCAPRATARRPTPSTSAAGTPSLLEPDEVAALITACREAFGPGARRGGGRWKPTPRRSTPGRSAAGGPTPASPRQPGCAVVARRGAGAAGAPAFRRARAAGRRVWRGRPAATSART